MREEREVGKLGVLFAKCPRSRRLTQFGLLLFMLLHCGAGFAAQTELAGEATTIPYFFSEHLKDEEKSYLALYQFVDFSAYNLGAERLDAYFAGWGRLDVMDKLDPEENAVGDAMLHSLFVHWRQEDNLIDVSAGRRLVTIGPITEQIDGGILEIAPWSDFGLQTFGGVPVFSEIGDREDDWGYGGRLYGGWLPYFEIGASGAGFLEKGDPDRAIFGGDLALFPIKWFDVLGRAYYDFLYGSLYDANTTVTVRPISSFKLLGQYERTMPTALLGMGSFFSVFSFDTITKYRSEAAGIISRRITLAVNYDHYVYDEADPAERYGGSIGVLWGELRDNTCNIGAYRLERANEDEGGYLELRGYLYQNLGRRFYGAADATQYRLDRKLYGIDYGFNGMLTAGWNVLPGFDLQAAGLYQVSPYYDLDLRALLRASFTFGANRYAAGL